MEDGGSPETGFVLFLLFILVEALFCGFASAIRELSMSDIEKKALDGDRKSVLLKRMLEHPVYLHNTVQMLVTGFGLAVGIVEVRLYGRLLYRWLKAVLQIPNGGGALLMVSMVLVTLLFLYLMLTFGMLVPKKAACKAPEKWAFGLVRFVYTVIVIVRPFTYLVIGTSNLILRVFGVDPHDVKGNVTEEEIISMVNEGHEKGMLLASEAEMINNIFEFGDKEAKDIMTHRKNMIAVDAGLPLGEVLNFILNQSNSRYPVYRDDIDNIIGILHLKDAMKFHTDERQRDKPVGEIEQLVRPVNFIPETRNINILFKNMQSQKIHMVVVVDEYGQTKGLVAMEDILEEIVGNIMDEYDEDENFILEQIDHSYLVKGMTPLEDMEDVLGIEFEAEEYDTLNGFLISNMNRIPSENEEFEMDYEGFQFKVLLVKNKMIETVKITKINPLK